MRVDICQTKIVWENKSENISNAERLIAESSADILLFPEMSFTGFSMNTELTGENDGYTLHKMNTLSKKYGKAVGFGWVFKDGEKAENHYTVTDGGEVLSDYVKIHPFSYGGENKYFKGGDKLSPFEFMGFKFLPAICYDLRFPEIFRAYEADIIIVPANWPEARQEHWSTLLKARAIENRCYVMGINCTGDIGDIRYGGGSALIDPDGNMLASAENKEGTMTVDLENDVTKYREKFPALGDKRRDVYIRLQPF